MSAKAELSALQDGDAMRAQTYEALKEIAYNIGGDLSILIDYFDTTPWDKSDKEQIEFTRLCLYYLHRPDLLTPEEYNKAKEIYKPLENRWKIKIS